MFIELQDSKFLCSSKIAVAKGFADSLLGLCQSKYILSQLVHLESVCIEMISRKHYSEQNRKRNVNKLGKNISS